MFKKKEWKDRITEYPTRRKLVKEGGDAETVTVERAEGQVSQEGDAFSAENMNDLEQRIGDVIGDTDISGIGDGTLTGAIRELNTGLEKGLANHNAKIYVSIPANTYKTVELPLDLPNENCKVLGIVSVVSYQAAIVPYGWYYNNEKAVVQLENISTSAVSNVAIEVRVIYVNPVL